MRESLAHIRELQDTFAFVYALVPLAAAAVLRGDDAWAAQILGTRASVTERTGGTVVDRSAHDFGDRAERDVRARLGADRWSRAYAAGRGTSIDALLETIDAVVATSANPHGRAFRQHPAEGQGRGRPRDRESWNFLPVATYFAYNAVYGRRTPAAPGRMAAPAADPGLARRGRHPRRSCRRASRRAARPRTPRRCRVVLAAGGRCRQPGARRAASRPATGPVPLPDSRRFVHVRPLA